jgi:hypothetical protein
MPTIRELSAISAAIIRPHFYYKSSSFNGRYDAPLLQRSAVDHGAAKLCSRVEQHGTKEFVDYNTAAAVSSCHHSDRF